MPERRFTELAKEHGFSDVRFVRPDPFTRWEQDARNRLTSIDRPDLVAAPRTLMANASALAVLFYSCPPFEQSELPPRYYLISQKAYHAAADLARAWERTGEQALCHPPLPTRAAALRAGGRLGRNGLYYHPLLGSFVHIQLLLITGVAPSADGEVTPCEGCGRCAAACPTDAVKQNGVDVARCIRRYLYSADMPLDMRPFVERLLGCERCQLVCPMNEGIAPVPIEAAAKEAFAIDELLEGKCKAAVGLIGPNYARKKFLQPQALLVAGAKRQNEHREAAERLREQGVPYAEWALSRLDEADT